jgi:hypothetical protein
VRAWQEHGDETARTFLLEAFYYIVRPIAGQIATKRFPPPLKMTQVAFDGQRDRIHELASVGIFGLFVAADRFNPESGYRFSTYADKWVRKYVQLYCEEIVSCVPRTGHMGIEEQGVGPCGPWVVYKPRRSVMDIIDAALARVRLYRGKAAGGMAVFDAGFLLDGIETEGGKLPDFEYLSTEGPTREYLQRRVGFGGARFVWPKVVSREVMAPWIDERKARPTDFIELPAKPVKRQLAFCGTAAPEVISTAATASFPPGSPMLDAISPSRAITAHGGGALFFSYGPSMRQDEALAEVCYLAKRRPDRQFRSYDNIKGPLDPVYGGTEYRKPKPKRRPGGHTPPWRNGLVIAFEYLRRSAHRKESQHENEILQQTNGVQTPPGARRRRIQRRAPAHDEQKRILQAGADRKARA